MRRIFLLPYHDRGRVPEIRRQVIDMAINGSGIHDTARVLRISPTTVIAVLKKSPHTSPRQPRVATSSSSTRPPRSRAIGGRVGRAAELNEMGSFVEAKEKARWLWHAVDHHKGEYWPTGDTRKEAGFLKLQALLTPFGITRYYTDKAGVYRRHLPPAQH